MEMYEAQTRLRDESTSNEFDRKTNFDYGVYPALVTLTDVKKEMRDAAKRQREREVLSRPKALRSGSFGRQLASRRSRASREVPARRGSSWLSVDPLAERYPEWSSYNYGIDNPLLLIDINGDSVVTIENQKWIQPTAVTVTPENQGQTTITIPKIMGLSNLAVAQGAATLEAEAETKALFGGIFRGIWTGADYVSQATNYSAALEVLMTAPTGMTSDVGLPETLFLGDVADVTSAVAKGFGWALIHNESGRAFENQFLKTGIAVGTLRIPAVKSAVESITQTKAAENAFSAMQAAFDAALSQVLK